MKKELVEHEVIERKLLTVLNDKSKVAIVADRLDIDILITALNLCDKSDFNVEGRARCFSLRSGLDQLRKEAFLRT